jgi:prepilin-type N-terminal cleavage/methylation domain-containing protein
VTRHRRQGEGGFTLIELLVVIAILSVLAAIVIINVTGVKGTANTAACNTDAQTVQTALDEYYNDHSASYPPGWANATTTLDSAGDLSPLGAYLSTTDLVGSGSSDACSSFTVAPSTDDTNSLTVIGTANT